MGLWAHHSSGPSTRKQSWRERGTLQDYLAAQNTVAIADVDTRRLTRLLREKGALAGCILADDSAGTPAGEAQALQAARGFAGLSGMDLAQEVTGPQRPWTQTCWSRESGYGELSEPKFKVVAYDFGVKRNILRILGSKGCDLTLVPAQTGAAEVLAMQPDGVFLSNGPGDPSLATTQLKRSVSFLTRTSQCLASVWATN